MDLPIFESSLLNSYNIATVPTSYLNDIIELIMPFENKIVNGSVKQFYSFYDLMEDFVSNVAYFVDEGDDEEDCLVLDCEYCDNFYDYGSDYSDSYFVFKCQFPPRMTDQEEIVYYAIKKSDLHTVSLFQEFEKSKSRSFIKLVGKLKQAQALENVRKIYHEIMSDLTLDKNAKSNKLNFRIGNLETSYGITNLKSLFFNKYPGLRPFDTGNVMGNVTGSVAGVTGNITGNVTNGLRDLLKLQDVYEKEIVLNNGAKTGLRVLEQMYAYDMSYLKLANSGINPDDVFEVFKLGVSDLKALIEKDIANCDNVDEACAVVVKYTDGKVADLFNIISEFEDLGQFIRFKNHLVESLVQVINVFQARLDTFGGVIGSDLMGTVFNSINGVQSYSKLIYNGEEIAVKSVQYSESDDLKICEELQQLIDKSIFELKEFASVLKTEEDFRLLELEYFGDGGFFDTCFSKVDSIKDDVVRNKLAYLMQESFVECSVLLVDLSERLKAESYGGMLVAPIVRDFEFADLETVKDIELATSIILRRVEYILFKKTDAERLSNAVKKIKEISESKMQLIEPQEEAKMGRIKPEAVTKTYQNLAKAVQNQEYRKSIVKEANLNTKDIKAEEDDYTLGVNTKTAYRNLNQRANDQTEINQLASKVINKIITIQDVPEQYKAKVDKVVKDRAHFNSFIAKSESNEVSDEELKKDKEALEQFRLIAKKSKQDEENNVKKEHLKFNLNNNDSPLTKEELSGIETLFKKPNVYSYKNIEDLLQDMIVRTKSEQEVFAAIDSLHFSIHDQSIHFTHETKHQHFDFSITVENLNNKDTKQLEKWLTFFDHNKLFEYFTDKFDKKYEKFPKIIQSLNINKITPDFEKKAYYISSFLELVNYVKTFDKHSQEIKFDGIGCYAGKIYIPIEKHGQLSYYYTAPINEIFNYIINNFDSVAADCQSADNAIVKKLLNAFGFDNIINNKEANKEDVIDEGSGLLGLFGFCLAIGAGAKLLSALSKPAPKKRVASAVEKIKINEEEVVEEKTMEKKQL